MYGLGGAAAGTAVQAVATEVFDVDPKVAGIGVGVVGAGLAIPTRGGMRAAAIGMAVSGVAGAGGEYLRDQLASSPRNAELEDGDPRASLAQQRANRELAARRELDAGNGRQRNAPVGNDPVHLVPKGS